VGCRIAQAPAANRCREIRDLVVERLLAERAGSAVTPWVAAVIPWLVGIAYLLALQPFALIAGTADVVLWPTGDTLQHTAGLRAFLAEPWSWPPLHTSLLHAPQGTSIVFTDSIPILALGAKAWQSLTGQSLTHLGPWIAMTYLLQPVAMAAVVRALGETRPLPMLAAAVMALSLPAFQYRFGHTALGSHWLLLLALALALGTADPERGNRRLALLGLLTWLLLLIHANLFAMAWAVAAAAWITAFLARPQQRPLLWRGLAAWLAVAALIFWVAGYGEVPSPGYGYGLYSMNLLSPWIPQASGLLPGFADWLVNPPGLESRPFSTLGQPWIALADMIDATGGQYEGYNYLGLGILLLVGLLLWRRRDAWELLAGRRLVALACVLLACFALSHQIYFGYLEIVRLLRPPNFLTQFRSSGRFFWPLAYLLLALGIVAAARLPRRGLGLALLTAALLLQLADTWPWHQRLYQQIHRQTDYVPEAAIWKPVIARHERLTIVPSHGCSVDNAASGSMELTFFAASVGRPVNSAYLARQPHIDCAAERAAAAAGPAAGVLLVLLAPLDADGPLPRVAWQRALCRRSSYGLACSQDWPALEAEGLATPFPR